MILGFRVHEVINILPIVIEQRTLFLERLNEFFSSSG